MTQPEPGPKMTIEQFMKFVAQEVRYWKDRPGYAERHDALEVRLDAGEVMTETEMAEALGVPLYVLQIGIMQALYGTTKLSFEQLMLGYQPRSDRSANR